jgi:hypothetical protein
MAMVNSTVREGVGRSKGKGKIPDFENFSDVALYMVKRFPRLLRSVIL